MARFDKVELMARELAAILLRNLRWRQLLDETCASLHADAARATPRQVMMAVAVRTESILRHIAQADLISVGRLYFDILPPEPHPLTVAVIEALSQPESVVQMMRDAGMAPQVRKDAAGVSYIEIETPDDSHQMCAVTRDAVFAAMTSSGDEPAQRLPMHTLH